MEFQDLSPWPLQRFAALITVAKCVFYLSVPYQTILNITFMKLPTQKSTQILYSDLRLKLTRGQISLHQSLLTTRNAPSPFDKILAEKPKARARQIEPFHKLICSMYTRPYVIKDVIELLTITDLAD
jgi:hypothetical protein